MMETIDRTAFTNIRIPSLIIEDMLSAVMSELNDARIGARFFEDSDFQIHASKMVEDILIAATLAQTLNADVPFNDVLPEAPLSGDEHDLRVIGKSMVSMLRSMPRIPDPSVSEGVLNARFMSVFNAV